MNGGRLIQMLWLGVAVQLAGDVVDLRWHASHSEFEGAADQIQAHWLLWLGVAAVLAVAAIALARTDRGPNRGFQLVLLASVAYFGVSVWHFAEHASGSDPELAHVLLVATQLAIIAGAVLATRIARRARLVAGSVGP